MPQNTRGNFSSDYVISEEVLATIAANAAKDVEGVARRGRRPAAVTMTDYDIRCHVYIDLVHTAKIQEVCRNVQTAVKEAIQNMTGRVVTRVDVSVTGIAESAAPEGRPDVTAAIEP